MRVVVISLIALALLGACSIRAPELDMVTLPQSQSADWPELVPLGPLLSRADQLAPRSTDSAARDLAWRAADLRRRAALLRALRLE